MCHHCENGTEPTPDEIASVQAMIDGQLSVANQGLDLLIRAARSGLAQEQGDTTRVFALMTSSLLQQMPSNIDPQRVFMAFMDNTIAAAIRLAELPQEPSPFDQLTGLR